MTSVLISIQPKWVEKIVKGEKTIEVRNTRPKLERPFKCYIYCTNGNGTLNDTLMSIDRRFVLNQKVIGDFVCDKIEEFHEYELSPSKKFYEVENARLDLFLKESCLSYNEVCDYRKKLPYYKPLYAWHISDLKIYDKPKELSEFRKPFAPKKLDIRKFIIKNGINNIAPDFKSRYDFCDKITRPPQSWCYVESLGE